MFSYSGILLRLESFKCLLLFFCEIFRHWFLEHGFNQVDCFLKGFKVVLHHAHQVSLGAHVEGGHIDAVFLYDLVENFKWVLFLESTCLCELLGQFINQNLEFCFERWPPGDAVFFLFLDVFTRDEGCVVKHHNVTLHDAITVNSGVDALWKINFVFSHFFGTSHLLLLWVEKLLRVAERA